MRAFTNQRAVDAPDSPTGYRQDFGPFPSAKPPEW
jgi:hypothetical protein